MNKLNLRTYEDLRFETYIDIQKEQIKRLHSLIEQLEYCLYNYESLRYRKQNQEISRLNNIIEEVRKCLNKNRVYIHGERNLSFEIEQILNKGE